MNLSTADSVAQQKGYEMITDERMEEFHGKKNTLKEILGKKAVETLSEKSIEEIWQLLKVLVLSDTTKKMLDGAKINCAGKRMIIKIEAYCGSHIDQVIEKALLLATLGQCLVQFDFNGCTVSVNPTATKEDIYAQWKRKMDRPDCDYNNPVERRKYDAERMKRNLKSKLAEIKRKKKDAATLEYIAGEKFETKYRLFWDDWKSKNTDMYGAGVFRYAENWAKLMQAEMKAGKKLTKKLIEETSFRADTEGISGFMHGCAQSSLISCWDHGLAMGEAIEFNYAKIIENRRISGLKNAKLARQNG